MKKYLQSTLKYLNNHFWNRNWSLWRELGITTNSGVLTKMSSLLYKVQFSIIIFKILFSFSYFQKKKFCWHDITEICWIWDAIDRRSLINVSNTFEELPNSNSFFFHILLFIFNIQLSVLLLFLCTEKVAPIFQGFHVNTKILQILI